jgi:hypothetical protein
VTIKKESADGNAATKHLSPESSLTHDLKPPLNYITCDSVKCILAENAVEFVATINQVRHPVPQADQHIAPVGSRAERVHDRLETRVENDVRALLVFEDFHRGVHVKVDAVVLPERVDVGIRFALKERLKLARLTGDTYLVLFGTFEGS